MTDPVEAVLFDIDGTLCAYHRPADELLADAFATVGVDPFFEIEEYFDRFDEFDADGAAIDEVRRRCFGTVAAERGHDLSVGHAVADAFAEERDHSNVRAREGALEAVRTLSADCRLGIVTNGDPDMQGQKLAALGVDDHFESVVYAGYDAPAKPAADPFHHALEPLGVDPVNAVYVGNSPRHDVPGALAAGCRVVWVPTEADLGRPEIEHHDPTYRLETLVDLVPPPWDG